MGKRSQFDDTGWPEQWARVQRWYGRATSVRRDPPAKGDRGEPEALDDVLAFFTNCYHLGDWLKNDRVDPHPEVIDFLHKDANLLICRDLANGTKHCVLDVARRPTYPTATTTAEVGWDSGARIVRWLIELTPGDFRDIFEIADRGMAAWRRFLGALPRKVTVSPGAAS